MSSKLSRYDKVTNPFTGETKRIVDWAKIIGVQAGSFMNRWRLFGPDDEKTWLSKRQSLDGKGKSISKALSKASSEWQALGNDDRSHNLEKIPGPTPWEKRQKMKDWTPEAREKYMEDNRPKPKPRPKSMTTRDKQIYNFIARRDGVRQVDIDKGLGDGRKNYGKWSVLKLKEHGMIRTKGRGIYVAV